MELRSNQGQKQRLKSALVFSLVLALFADWIEFGGAAFAAKLPRRPSETSAKMNSDQIQRETIVLGAGCFWGAEELLRQLPGVLSTDVGYSGGSSESPKYEEVKKGDTGHVEVVQVVFDLSKITLREILVYFFRLHDPTTLNRQGNDRGTQYRSVIFVANESQRKVAEGVRGEVSASGKWKNPVVTAIEPARPFYRAEEYHQDYLVKNPGGYTCHYLRD